MRKGWLTAVNWRAGPIDYRNYHFSLREVIIYLCQGGILAAGMAFVFYQDVSIALLSLLFSPIYLYYQKKRLQEVRQDALRQEFKEAMLCIMSALGAGYSVENAWQEAGRELAVLIGENALMVQEMRQMVNQIADGKQLEQLLYEFSERADIEEIRRFCESFSLARRKGGNLIEIMSQAVTKITDKMTIMAEARVLVAAKRFEQRIMNVMPLALIVFLNLTAPEFLSILYVTNLGRIIMSICLLIYFTALLWSEKILQIEF